MKAGEDVAPSLERVAPDPIQDSSEGQIYDSLSVWQIWGFRMGKPHPIELRQRVVACVEEGHSHRSTVARFRVSVKFVNDMVILKRETGGLQPRRQGNGGGHGKLSSLRDWIETRIGQTPDLTLNDLVAELADQHGLTIHRVSVWRFVRSLGLTHKKRPPGRAIVRHWFKRNGGRAEAA
jgi:transposase